jgi:exopolyphosphatase / guanosine-5'-triphosphate,3'-diphosphate pyrophosphatase
VSTERAPQIVAGALVAEASMKVLDVESVDICPWALREGLILRKLDSEADGTALVETSVTGRPEAHTAPKSRKP